MTGQLHHLFVFTMTFVVKLFPDLDILGGGILPHFAQALADAGKRCLQVALDVVRERLQGRDIDDLRLVRELAGEPLTDQPVDGRQESGQRLTGARGCRDQDVATREDRGPGLGLGGRGRRGLRRRPPRCAGEANSESCLCPHLCLGEVR